MKASTSTLQQRSRNAVAVAGTRQRGAPVKSAGYWTLVRGKREGPFRPGKTALGRKPRKAAE